MSQPVPVDAHLVAGGRYHDIDFARLELLKLLGARARARSARAAAPRHPLAIGEIG